MYCFKNYGFEDEGFDPGGIASGASHRAGNQKLKEWVPDKGVLGSSLRYEGQADWFYRGGLFLDAAPVR